VFTLPPTLIPGGFIATPAAGVTTIEAAEIIKGETPIDAIWIRVAGIDTYNKIGHVYFFYLKLVLVYQSSIIII
jgi:hypothetical protein